jgi:hypothetical protein
MKSLFGLLIGFVLVIASCATPPPPAPPVEHIEQGCYRACSRPDLCWVQCADGRHL